ncbi:reverse transcriptase domain-containing protein [Tanacetum coccineum]
MTSVYPPLKGFVNAAMADTDTGIEGKRSLYGLKQAPRAWFQRFAGYATRAGFYHTSCPALLQQIIGSLNNEFDMTDLGTLNYFLGISVDRTLTCLFLSQKKYALQLLERAHMVTCHPSRTPVDTESKLGPEVQQICLMHFAALKRILQYVRGTLDFGLQLYVSATTSLVSYTNADWAGCPSTRRAISSPSHPTSNIEDAFSYNFLDYIPASLDYVPALPGKTYSSSLNNSFGLVPIASPTLSLFHDDPYMKVMHAYYAKESPIPPPTIVHIFNAISNIGEISHKISLEHHKEQIEEILNHLDELSLDRIEHIEDKIEGLRNSRVIIQQDFDNLEVELRESHTQIAKIQRKQMGNNSKIALARFRIANLEQIIEDIQIRCLLESISNKMPPKRTSTSEAPAMTQAAIKKLVADSVSAGSEGAVGLICWFERTESVFSLSNCTKDCKVKFAIGTLTEEALSWWNSFAQPIGIKEAYKITRVEFKRLLIKK